MPEPFTLPEPCTSPPWPASAFVLDLDALDPTLDPDDLLALERRATPVVGLVQGHCEGLALAAAASVQLLVAGPDATFRARGPGTDLALRRLVGLVGRRVATYLVVESVTADEAFGWGLASRVVPDPEVAARECCARLGARAPTAVEVIMGQLGWDAPEDHAHSRVTAPILDGEAAPSHISPFT